MNIELRWFCQSLLRSASFEYGYIATTETTVSTWTNRKRAISRKLQRSLLPNSLPFPKMDISTKKLTRKRQRFRGQDHRADWVQRELREQENVLGQSTCPLTSIMTRTISNPWSSSVLLAARQRKLHKISWPMFHCGDLILRPQCQIAYWSLNC